MDLAPCDLFGSLTLPRYGAFWQFNVLCSWVYIRVLILQLHEGETFLMQLLSIQPHKSNALTRVQERTNQTMYSHRPPFSEKLL